jgi:uncharacterized protein DUF1572
MFVTDFLDEYDKYRRLGENAMAQVSDEALNRVVATDGNSIAMIVRHVSGNLVSRFTDFLTADGEKPSRDRDDEFAERIYSRDEVIRHWNAGFDVVSRELAKLTDPDLARAVQIRGIDLTVNQALCRSLAHTASHTGQIVLLARIVASGEWKSLSIPRGQSRQYNQNPTSEKGPPAPPITARA